MKLKELKTRFNKGLARLTKSPILMIVMFLKVGITIGIFYIFYWAGLKGILMFIMGMAVMCTVLFTKNPIALMFIRMMSGKLSLYKILKGEMPNDEEKEEFIEVGRKD